ncbi:bifunctional 23S rRNA (guanine(2069)-N(7))-methyltransferase RlmK/23S rRNA (guanine(2445)-N(2))-methyltransferase RlmL [bacterium]|nr:bifunctional 23S rRNA (guanine(2069)-N(7))-methyltransferase RlmK/23S rRNA (guanine(2445)-N(2))-methyltransferase RlmL [candidate division CSSED10-310 bacterium]
MNPSRYKCSNSSRWFASVPKTMEGLLASEISSLGGADVRETSAGVNFVGDLKTAYRVILWSRLASRVQLFLSEFSAGDRQALYNGVRSIDWTRHIPGDCTFVIHTTAKASVFNRSEFASMVAKDAIVDQFRDTTGSRPSVDKHRADVAVHLHIVGDKAALSMDMTCQSLHRRGYRFEQGDAPLRENVAAAILLRAGWPDAFRENAAFIDPMCGAGTMVIEAALMAADAAPGIIPGAAGLNKWQGHDFSIWNDLIVEAEQRRREGLKRMPVILGVDTDRYLVEIARKNAARAQMEHSVEFRREDLSAVRSPSGISTGLIAVNPPYGKRLETDKDVVPLYDALGRTWVEHFQGWNAVLITSEKAYARSVGLRASKINTIFNGGIECVAVQFAITPENKFRPYHPGAGLRHGLEPRIHMYEKEAVDFENRLQKNRRILASWLKRNQISCYRLYDADLPNYALAVDLYENKWAVVQEYAPPATVDPIKANDRLHAALHSIQKILGLDPRNIFLKQRRRLGRAEQYEKTASEGQFEEIEEGGLRFLANFSDYLDTGIFLDHRPLRQRIRAEVEGKRFLNLFCYTSTATVFALAGKASFARSVDSSNTYLAWSEANLRRNGFNPDNHPLIRSDCMEWLSADRDKYDIIFCDPPTYSSSKDRDPFDVQKDHVRLIQKAVNRLQNNGTLYFSTNFRKFHLDTDALKDLYVKEISRETIPRDFQRNPRIHRCWIISASCRSG